MRDDALSTRDEWESFAVRVLELVSMHARDWGANRRKAQRAALAKHKGANQ